MENDKTILELDDEYVLYYNEKSNNHGESLSINIFDDPNEPESTSNKINEWLEKNGGTFSESEKKVYTEKYSNMDYTPFYFKITSQTKIIDLDGKRVSKDELVKHTNIGLVARAVPYEYDGRSGVTRLLETVVVYEPKHRTRTNLEHITKMREARLAQKANDSEIVAEKPSADVEKEPSSDAASPLTSPEVDLSRIPF